MPEVFEAVGNSSCEWDNSTDEVQEECVQVCEDEYEDLSDSEQEDVDACVECMEAEIGDSCGGDDWIEALADDCESECMNDSLGEFFDEGFEEEFDEEIECNEGSATLDEFF